MSAESRNYVYRVKVTDQNFKEATISKETLQQYKQDVAKYLKKPNGTQN